MRSTAAALILSVAAACAVAQEGGMEMTFPPDVDDPNEAIKDPKYNDPVFFWRMVSTPDNPFEPDDYFYWPPAIIEGEPGPFLPRADETTIPAATLDAMADWAQAHSSNVLIVMHKGKVQSEHYWNDTKPEDLLNGRAITRSVTPLALGFALEAGKVRLDDPIGKFIHEWAADKRGEITVRELAQGVSGLEVAESRPFTQVHDNKDLCLVYCGDVVRAALDYDYARPPGTRFELAQENIQLLALVIERAMGQAIQDLVSERIWKPMGGSDAAFQFDRPDGTARVMCCMRARPRDWARLGVLVSQGGRWQGRQVLPKGWVDTMATPSARNPNMGLYLWMGSPYNSKRTYFEGTPGAIPQSEPFLADDVLMMEGGGFRIVHMVPSEELVIFRHGQFDTDWDAAFLVNTALRGLGYE